MDSELKVLGLLAGWAEGHTLVPALISQVTVGDSENLAILLKLDVRLPQKDRSGKRWLREVRPRRSAEVGCTEGACCLGKGRL